MPQGKGTYGSQVGRPSEGNSTVLGGKRTSYVNDNKWWSRLSQGFKNLKSYNPQKIVRSMEFREGLSKPEKENKVFSEEEMRSNQNRVVGSDAQWTKLRQEHWNVFKDPNKPKDYWEKKRRSDRESGYGSY